MASSPFFLSFLVLVMSPFFVEQDSAAGGPAVTHETQGGPRGSRVDYRFLPVPHSSPLSLFHGAVTGFYRPPTFHFLQRSGVRLTSGDVFVTCVLFPSPCLPPFTLRNRKTRFSWLIVFSPHALRHFFWVVLFLTPKPSLPRPPSFLS